MRLVIDERRKQNVATTCGALFFLIGIGAAICGCLLVIALWILGAEIHPWLKATSTALLVAVIPLVLGAGYCLDWSERRKQPDHRQQTPKFLIAALALPLLLPVSLRAQQTIFNVPSTDVLDKGKVYVELDASLKPTDDALVKKFSSLVPRVVVGAGNHLEVGLNITGNIQPGPDTTTLVPTIKWKPYQGDNGWAVVLGDDLFVPVRNRAYNAGNYVYAEASKSFKTGTRITFGGYDFTKDVVAAANRAGGQFGFEQPLSKSVTIAADWLTGKHANGYFTPGVVFKVGPKITGYAGYSIGNANASNGNHFFLLELGYNLN
jgi:hypothetical protein